MKLKTVRVRRNRPSVLSAALALMLTMLFVYLISLSNGPEAEADPVAAQTVSSGDIRMEGLSVAFDCAGRYDAPLDARVAAAQCTQAGGAGLVLPDGAQYAVIRGVSSGDEGESTLTRSAGGLTLHLSGPTAQITAVSDAVAFLRAQATETGSLALNLEAGNADASSMATLLEIYRTQGERALAALREIPSGSVINRLTTSVQSALSRLESAAQPTPAKIRLIHAASCAEWISLLEEFTASANKA